MLSLSRVCMLIDRLAVKIRKSLRILREILQRAMPTREIQRVIFLPVQLRQRPRILQRRLCFRIRRVARGRGRLEFT